VRKFNVFISGCVFHKPKVTLRAYGAVIEENGSTRELSACHQRATKRRIRLLGVVAALETLPEPCEATVYVDSEYIVDTFNKDRAEKWRSEDWHISNGKKAKNADLWGALLDLIEKRNVYVVLLKNINVSQGYGYDLRYTHKYHARCFELAIEAVKRGK
jgi:ribonuclease HI